MAFYPDELSPIERLRGAGKPSELADLNLMSINRRQWKSLVLGRKDLGMNNFATIAEEKEEDISSDGSNGAGNQKAMGTFPNVPTKKIMFPKPRKYITPDSKDDEHPMTADTSLTPAKECLTDKRLNNVDDLSKIVNSPKMNLPEVRHLIKSKIDVGEENVFLKPDVVNYAVNDTGIDKQWMEVTANPPLLTGWPKPEVEKKPKDEKKRVPLMKNQNKKLDTKKTVDGPKAKVHNSGDIKNKSLNMKDVVNVYKNLAYGTKDEIKSFVEKLSFVKEEEKGESDKNMLSMMNLKALETKIKDLEKKSPVAGGAQAKKRTKTIRKSRKVHAENLARHKVVKVPATLDYTCSPDNRNVNYGDNEQKRKSGEEKVPWKYVGTQSVLDKTYFVYPAYPQQERKKPAKKLESEIKKAKKEGTEEASAKTKPSQTKVKQSKEILIRQNSVVRSDGSRFLTPVATRSSATTVCTVEFRPETERKALSSSEHSLLVYLHGTKATHVRSPYSDRQFSRVKFFRKDESRVPLIRGVLVGDPNRAATVQNVRMPYDSDRVYDLLDFEEDIQNINEFLHSQIQSGGPGPGKRANRKRRRTAAASGDDDLLVEEISRDIESLQYLPDTEENRQIIGNFFSELERRIERSKSRHIIGDHDNHNSTNNCLIPIVGY